MNSENEGVRGTSPIRAGEGGRVPAGSGTPGAEPPAWEIPDEPDAGDELDSGAGDGPGGLTSAVVAGRAGGGARAEVVVRAVWTDGALHLWGEVPPGTASSAADNPDRATTAEAPAAHPHVLGTSALAAIVERALGGPLSTEASPDGVDGATTKVVLRLPTRAGTARAVPSPHVAHTLGVDADDETGAGPAIELGWFGVPTVRVPAERACAVLDAIEDMAGREDNAGVAAGESLKFFASASRLVRHMLAQQRFVPMVEQQASGSIRGVWMPWLGDEATSRKALALLGTMPASARCVQDGLGHDGMAILSDFMLRVGDALCRAVMRRETMHEAIEGRDATTDLHVAWLTGLLTDPAEIDARPGPRADLVKGVRRWIGGLDERTTGGAWRMLMRLSEPIDLSDMTDLAAPGDGVRWTLSLHLRSVADERVVLDAADIWALPPGPASVEGQRVEAPQELLLAELGRAARVYKRLERVLEEAEPASIELSTSEAYKFLREFRPLLIEQGFGVEAPEWWDSPSVRLGARLIVNSEDIDLQDAAPPGARSGNEAQIGLSSLVSYRWQIAVGETSLTLEQFERLAAQHSPLIRLNGRWVEVRPEDVKAAMRFIRENPGGKMEVGRALRLAYASDAHETGVPILGMEATGWVASVFGDPGKSEKMPMIESPRGFVGTLRPYQLKGLSWLAFLDRIGLGACLADDMGLGKTIQLLALLAHERGEVVETATPDAPAITADDTGGALGLMGTGVTPRAISEEALKAAAAATVDMPARPESGPGPTLLVVPMSVVANWVHEARRFTPRLRVHVHHGADRPLGDRLVATALASDVVITTYALAHRDREHLERIGWSRVVLDEAQNIKNPGAKQTRAIHALPATRRIALTGTPLENRLIELWSIMDFLNPGYLGPAGEFRRVFAVPIERYRDRHKASQMRGLVQPFVLRRLKSDPSVITDLPEKVETKEYCYLTPEQANLYQSCVSDMLAAAERAEGIQRRGLVLAGLIKLKQICNHPAQFLKEFGEAGAASGAPPINPARSGKCQRLVEMLQEVVAAGDKALVFTQFRQMGHLLATMLRKSLDRDVLFLHGGTAAGQRQQIVAEFQGERSRAGAGKGARSGPPVLLLSLKAGGVGLNLTAANHVFHFDRWWNPAVEAQATDRAYRIGQTRTVQVHKFVVSGTLEERIDQMIEQKTELASEIVGSGEDWLTELDTASLRDLLTLRRDAIGDDVDVLEAGA